MRDDENEEAAARRGLHVQKVLRMNEFEWHEGNEASEINAPGSP